MGLTILRGRGFRVEDAGDAPKVAIVNEQFARHYWPNEDPIGKRIRLVNRDQAWAQVVGLAKMSKYLFIAEPPTEFVYFPSRQTRVREMVMLVQSAGDPASLAGPLWSAGQHLRRATAGGGLPDGRRPAGFRRAADRDPDRAHGHVPRRLHPRAARGADEPDAGAAARVDAHDTARVAHVFGPAHEQPARDAEHRRVHADAERESGNESTLDQRVAVLRASC